MAEITDYPLEWSDFFKSEAEIGTYCRLMEFVQKERKTKCIYPSHDEVFHALELTPPSSVKVVILGQDPYHQPHQAHGLSFSVNDGVKVPPSLRNIKKEITQDLKLSLSESGCLIPWAQQGVLLLNSVLTVEDSKPHSHANIGWEKLTDRLISFISDFAKRPLVFMLWGKPAQKKAERICGSRHLILRAAHPSPLSAYRGFFGCSHFSQCNRWLKEHGREEINWSV